MISVICALRDMADEKNVIKNIGQNRFSEIILVGGKSPSYQRNAGVKHAAGDIVYFIDDDSILPDGIMQKAENFFAANPGTAVYGGPELYPKTDSFLQKSFGDVFSSPFASGRSSMRYKRAGIIRESSEKEIILCNMFVRKDIFEELKGFDERLYPNEENEFLNRVSGLGLKIIHDPDLYIYRSKRKEFKGFVRQCFNYGRGRTEQSFVNFSLTDLINFVPAFFVIYLLAQLSIGGMGLLPLMLYAVIDAAASVKIGSKSGSAKGALLAFVNFFLLHVSYGAGTICGFVTSFTLNDRQPDTEIHIKKIRA